MRHPVPLTRPVVVPVPAELAPDTPANRACLAAANLEGREHGRVEVDAEVFADGHFHGGLRWLGGFAGKGHHSGGKM